MADRPITKRPMTADLEGSGGGDTSVLIFGIAAACLFVLLVLTGLGAFDGKMAPAPPTPQPTTQSPAPTGSTNP
jgi:hypothetical protein